jgi:hypothetical protein
MAIQAALLLFTKQIKLNYQRINASNLTRQKSNLLKRKKVEPPPLNLIALCNLTTAEESPFSMA